VKHVLCVHLHQLPIDRFRRRQPGLWDKPFVLVQTIGNRQIVVHVTADELPEVHPGMSLAEAKGRYLGLPHFPVAPADDLRALEAIGRWLMRFSPNVSLLGPWSIFLDATGVERLFGGIENFRDRVAHGIQSLRFSAGVAIAPTPGAAWALAAFKNDFKPPTPVLRYSEEPDLHTHQNIAAVLAPLPPEALRLEAGTSELLASLGVRTIGQLLQLERKALAVRFGAGILLRIDQAIGTAPEPLVFLEHRTPVRAAIEFEATIESLEVIHLAVRQVVGQVVELLARRGHGARELRLVFRCPYAPAVEKTIRLMRPSRNGPAIFNLLRCALENIALDDGVIAVELYAKVTQRLSDEQSQLIGGEEQENAIELDHLVERLRARLPSGVNRVELLESHIPERAFGCREEVATATASRQLSLRHAAISEFRPLSLLPRPRAIKVIVTPSECLDGQPVSFTDRGAVHRLDYVRGPERMTGEWWTGQHKTRDYFDALDTGGNRYWLFRISETRRWYLHGSFE
jgi:protein ImuB